MEAVESVEQAEEVARAPVLNPLPDISPFNRRGESDYLPARSPSREELARELKKAEIIRPELNIEKHADFIFAPSHSKNLGTLKN